MEHLCADYAILMTDWTTVEKEIIGVAGLMRKVTSTENKFRY